MSSPSPRGRNAPLALALSLLAVCSVACSGGAADSVPAAPRALQAVGLSDAEPAFERVVVVTIDTLRADHLASYGYFRTTSPFLDRLAERSVVFERALSASSHTAPSHASMFTGLVPGLHGLLVNGSRLGADVETLAEALDGAGFESAAFTSVEFLEGVAQGFDSVRAKTTMASGISNAAISWLRKSRGSDRFLLWLHFYDPHRWKATERAPREHLEALRAATTTSEEETYAAIAALHDLPLPFEPMEWRSGDKGAEQVRPATRAEVIDFVDSYDAQIAYADAEIGRVYAALEALELGGETLWIVTSDHGEGLGSHDYAGHGWQIYQEQLRVPLLVHATGGAFAPRRVGSLVSTIDLFPTVVDLQGGHLEGELARWSGRSLAPLLHGAELPGAPGAPRAFAQRRPLRKTGGDGVFALQSERFKYILRMTGEDEFYDLAGDPLERENLIGAGGVDRDALRTELEERLGAFTDVGRTAEEGAEAWHDELRRLGYAE